MHLFYTPDIKADTYILDELQSKHCIQVLRLKAGDIIFLTDGKGTLFRTEIADANRKACMVKVIEREEEFEKRTYELTMAVAPTKNPDRYEWFLEKATEIGCDVFVPLISSRSERKTLKRERALKVITSAVKQSLKAYHPQLSEQQDFQILVQSPFDGIKLIAHCNEPVKNKTAITRILGNNQKIMILVGPEGDFSPDEVKFAVANGFEEITLGNMRLRTETAALMCVAAAAMASM